MKDLLRLLGLGRSTRERFALGALLALVVVLANVALLGLAGWFITAMAAAGLAGLSINYFTPAAGIRAFALLRTVGRYVERLVNHDATLRLLSRLRVWVYTRIEPLAPAVLARYRRGDVLSRLVGDVDALDNAWLRIFSPVAVAVVGAASLFVFLLFFSVSVAWVDLGLLAVIGLALPVFTQRLGRRPATRAAAAAGELKAELSEDFAGLAELAVLGATRAHQAQNAARDQRLLGDQNQGLRIEAVAAGLALLATGIATAATWLLAAPEVARGSMDPLFLALLVFVVLASTEAVQGLPSAFRVLGDTLAAARRVFEIADEKPQVAESPNPQPVIPGHGIVFERVCFRYAPGADWAIDHLSFELPEGAAIAIVGPSGAGKSSISQLLLRFYDPDHGNIRVGGRDIQDYAFEALRRQFAWATQSTRLFSTTIRENLRLAEPAADDAALWTALNAACLADEVRAFPRGLDHFVGAGGMALSAGQARRLALARAWLCNAPILLLDEATEGLDTENERTLVNGFTRERGTRSLIWITHRLAGLESMDRILVMDRGHIIESGSHAELIARAGFYRHMADYLAA